MNRRTDTTAAYTALAQRRAVEGRKRQGRLNQWTRWARAQGPGFFFFLRSLQLTGEINIFNTNYLIVAINETVWRLTVFVIQNSLTVKACSCAALGQLQITVQ